MFFPFSRLLTNNGKWLEQQQTSILSAAMIIGGANVVSALSGLLVRRLLIAEFFHGLAAQQALEAFWFAFQIPDTLFQLIVLGALSAAFIPIFMAQKKANSEQAFVMSSIMMNILLVIFLVTSVVVFILAKPITQIRSGPEFTPDQLEIVVNLTRLMLISTFFFAISNFLTGILQSFHRFVLPAVAPILYNLGIMAGVYLFADRLGIYSAGLGVIMGAFIHMAVQLPLVGKLGFRYRFSLNWHHVGIKEFFKLMPPRVLALGANEIRKLLLGFFATSLGNLSFFMMQLGLSLMTIPIRFFGIPISQASLPFLSAESTEKDLTDFKNLVLKSLHQIAFLTMPSSVLLLILRLPIVRLVFGTFNFPWEATKTTSKIVAIIALSITVQALVQLLIRAFYALRDTKTPLVVAAVDVMVYLLICAFLVFATDFGVLGLATATTITAILEFLLLLILLDKRVKGFARSDFWIPQIKMMVASLLMAVLIYLPYRILDEVVFETSRTMELIGLTVTTSTIGMLVYIFFALLFDIRELKMLTKLIYTFDRWRKPLLESKEVLMETPMEGN